MAFTEEKGKESLQNLIHVHKPNARMVKLHTQNLPDRNRYRFGMIDYLGWRWNFSIVLEVTMLTKLIRVGIKQAQHIRNI